MLEPALHAESSAIPDLLAVRAHDAMGRALANLAGRQEERGSWAGDYGGPMFLLPMYVALRHAGGQAARAPSHRSG